MTKLAEQLRAWRRRMGITQVQAAAIMDVSVRTYQGWEIGRTARLNDRIFEMAMAYAENSR